MRFTIRDLIWLTVVASLALAWFFVKPNTPGRYTFGVHPSRKSAILLDTATGQCWERYGSEWIDIGNPAQPGN